jgi:2,3-bisphosphoglycerate-independent phosphoglycerate mutase
MRCLLFFLDGVGLGSGNPQINPFAQQPMPALSHLLGNRRLSAETFTPQPQHSERASWLGLDACMGIPGIPQSATGQAALLTGLNIPSLVGGHYGPKPSPEIISLVKNGNLLKTLHLEGHSSTLLNAYPPRYFETLRSGYRLPGVIAMTAIQAGISLKTIHDLQAGRAISADFTGKGWLDQLKIADIPVITPNTAGVRMAQLSSAYSFSIFDYWVSDIAGHHQDMQAACSFLATLDDVLAGLVHTWADEDGLILITSDHGNLEDLSSRRHTTNPVPLIMIGACHHRHRFVAAMENENPGSVYDLTRVAPAIKRFID